MKQHNLKSKSLILSTLLCSIIGTTGVQADDIEVYLLPPPDPATPNVLFVLDESGSMNWNAAGTPVPDTNTGQRMHQLQAAMWSVLQDPDNGNVNAGILEYTTGNGNNLTNVLHDFAMLDTKGADMATLIGNPTAPGDGLNPGGGTPSVHALASAVLWYDRGYRGNASPIPNTSAGNWCAPNYIVFMTDGQPNSNYSVNNLGGTLKLDTNPDTYRTTACTRVNGNPGNGNGDSCAGEIVNWGLNTDLKTGAGWTGDQNIITHTVGMGPAANTGTSETAFMQYVAAQGGGTYFPASNAQALTEAFQTIIDQAQTAIEYTYTSPSIPFDPANAATSGEDIYLPLFEPSATKFWKGNLKNFHIEFDVSTGLSITAKGGDAVVDNNFVLQSVRDFWNDGAKDEAEPLVGGVASKLNGARKLYTHLGGQAQLIHANNRIHKDNPAISETDLGVTAVERNALLNWANWRNADNSARLDAQMGAPLHTHPVSVGDYIFINTTEGILHAFDKSSGEEKWAFMPDELLNTIKDAKADDSSSIPMYGLDGPMTYYESAGKQYLVFGMRRGGRNYYALDITVPASPKFAWEIIGGTGSYTQLGQSWSKPILTQIEKNGGTTKDVLIFGGGYDTDQDASYIDNNNNGEYDGGDTAIGRVDDNIGNAIYIINPANGNVIETITNSDMDNGIAADILPVDINSNGITDRLYASDVGGRIIRVDIPDKALKNLTGSGAISTYVVADVNHSGGANDFQRFFNTPEVGYYNRAGTQYLSIMITSGHTPDPLSTSVTHDRFYMIKDTNVWSAPSSTPTVLDEGDLYDATANLVQDGSASQQITATSALESSDGWYIDLENKAEKGYSAAKLFDSTILFTTYSGERLASNNNDSCTAGTSAGTARLYALDMSSGGAVFPHLDGSDINSSATTADRTVELQTPGIPPSPTLVFPDEGGEINVGAGLELDIARIADRFRAVSWEEMISD